MSFETIISNDPESGDLIAEIWHEDEQVAELSEVRGKISIELFAPASGSFYFLLDEFTEALDWAKQRLTAMDDWDEEAEQET